MTTVNEVNNDKTKVLDEFIFFSVFRLFFFFLMSKLIHSQCLHILQCIKTMAAYMYAHKQLGLCVYVLVHYFVVLVTHL